MELKCGFRFNWKRVLFCFCRMPQATLSKLEFANMLVPVCSWNALKTQILSPLKLGCFKNLFGFVPKESLINWVVDLNPCRTFIQLFKFQVLAIFLKKPLSKNWDVFKKMFLVLDDWGHRLRFLFYQIYDTDFEKKDKTILFKQF